MIKDRFTLLLASLFCIGTAFFIGLYFGRALDAGMLSNLKKGLQVSLEIHGNTIRTERSDEAIRIIINGAIVSDSGETRIEK